MTKINREPIHGMQDIKLEEPTLECPRCLDETLVRIIGNLAVCPGCELMIAERSIELNVYERNDNV